MRILNNIKLNNGKINLYNFTGSDDNNSNYKSNNQLLDDENLLTKSLFALEDINRPKIPLNEINAKLSELKELIKKKNLLSDGRLENFEASFTRLMSTKVKNDMVEAMLGLLKDENTSFTYAQDLIRRVDEIFKNSQRYDNNLSSGINICHAMYLEGLLSPDKSIELFLFLSKGTSQMKKNKEDFLIRLLNDNEIKNAIKADEIHIDSLTECLNESSKSDVVLKYLKQEKARKSFPLINAIKASIKYTSRQLEEFFGFYRNENDYYANINDVENILDDYEKKATYKKYLQEGIETPYALILANIPNAKGQEEDIVTLLKNIGAKRYSEDRISRILKNLISDSETKISDLNKYMSQLDKEKIAQLAPDFKEFDPIQYLNFCLYHLSNNTVDFNEKNLTFCDNPTEYFRVNPTNYDKLEEIYTRFPMTKREIGKVPQSFLEFVPKEKHQSCIEQLYNEIEEFRKNHNIRIFEQKLRSLLNQEIKIEKIDTGKYGDGYRIDTQDNHSYCLKIYKNDKQKSSKKHGVHIEPQIALFANSHSKEYVKMHFGKVAPPNKNDGFIVTTYIDENSTPTNEETEILDYNYAIDNSDTSEVHNKINGIIYDFGGIIIREKNANSEANFNTRYSISEFFWS